MLDGDDEDDKQRSTEHLLAVLAYVKKQRTACLPKMFAFCCLHHGIGFLVEREKLILRLACSEGLQQSLSETRNSETIFKYILRCRWRRSLVGGSFNVL